jgi:hypothetical protein
LCELLLLESQHNVNEFKKTKFNSLVFTKLLNYSIGFDSFIDCGLLKGDIYTSGD